MAYLVVAYPQLTNDHYVQIQDFRKAHDQLYFNVIEPHFTIVFPVFDMARHEFVDEVRARSVGMTGFDFVIRCATVNKDAFNEYYHSFLVPDEGYSRIVKLHDSLYSEKLSDHLRLDIDFIPHIGIGNSKDPHACKKMTDLWHENEFAIHGRISMLAIVQYENNTTITIGEIQLR